MHLSPKLTSDNQIHGCRGETRYKISDFVVFLQDNPIFLKMASVGEQDINFDSALNNPYLDMFMRIITRIKQFNNIICSNCALIGTIYPLQSSDVQSGNV